ncbi:uncharacterized protein E0L32_001437 [Thyridium curvatum]|uniref:Transcriptional regulatory protein RXT2 N-terminal domain-containing protein n=1 Tax=Thyridium curvatum TaxID=1093900 RepID=A0A507B113_9PEZI|nr:uncharacterized protein E0L32_001437 [Thyridium curvatum]TPX10240.1 hypothetical protein E0L32_001437 [Thyridium curvatum]
MATTKDQVLFTDTFLALKKAVKRKAYESDSDSSIDQPTNRGNKLKKKARLVREGQLNAPSGASDMREIVDHSGYQRAILERNPPLIDDDGYELESGDDEEHVREVMASVAELNPYASIRLENILAPLTAVTDLPTHPTMSRVFTSEALDELCIQARNWMHRENAALWKVRPLLTRLCGDHTWIPCEALETPNDISYFEDENASNPPSVLINGTSNVEAPLPQGSGVNGTSHAGGSTEMPEKTKQSELTPTVESENKPNAEGDTSMVDAGNSDDQSKEAKTDAQGHNEDSAADADNKKTDNGSEKKESLNGGDHEGAEDPDVTMTSDDAAVKNDSGKSEVVSGDTAGDVPAGSLSPGASEAVSIHPLFLAPRSAHPERDAGLPEQEAEDVRRLVQLWVQKQEEVARGAKNLYEGLLRADRLRKTVLRWAKAEAHCGPNEDMSDGEDWYDKEEWGLTEDLKKGHDEEEEDIQLPPKKTRTRRQ